MILTITLNPSVDIGYTLDAFQMNEVNRVENASKTAGGKGLNVARVLHQLQEEVGAAGFLGGNLGNFIREAIQDLGVQDYFTSIAGDTRNCIAVIHEGKQTEILESGPVIVEEEAKRFLDQLQGLPKEVEVITMSGSLPKGLAEDFYQQTLQVLDHPHAPVVFLDTKGSLLKETLAGEIQPFLIKPNEDELADLVEENLHTEQEMVDVLSSPTFSNVPHVVVTLGAKGALIKQNDTIYRAEIPEVEAINPVGSGDSVLAGFAAGYSRGLRGVEWIQFGLTMGVLNAMEAKTGKINPEKIEGCMQQIKVTPIV